VNSVINVLVITLFLGSGLVAHPVQGEDSATPAPAIYIKTLNLESGPSPGEAVLYVELVNRSAERSPPLILKATDQGRSKVHKTLRLPDGIAGRDRIRQRLEVSLTTVPGRACYVVELEVPGQETSYWTRRLACTYVRALPDESAGTDNGENTLRYRLPDNYKRPVPDLYQKKLEDRQVK